MQFAKVAPPGFERETRGRPIVTLFCRRILNERRHHGWPFCILCIDPVFVFSAEIWVELIPNMPCIIRDLPRAPLDPATPMGYPMGVWFEILMVCWPCICFQCWKLRKLIPNMPCIIRFFRDPSWTPRDPPVGPKVLPRSKGISG